jgi:hypothetical protein
MSGAGSSVYGNYGNPAEKESGMAAYADLGGGFEGNSNQIGTSGEAVH